MGFCEPPSGEALSCQIVVWGTCSLDTWRGASPNTVPGAFDLNMNAIYVLPQLSGDNFGYARLPNGSIGCFAAPPVGGTYAMPAQTPDRLVAQLKSQHLTQSLIYGAVSSAVAHAPPPPGRGRSLARGSSNVRAAPVVPPAPANLGVLICSNLPPVFLCRNFERFHGRPDGPAASDHLSAQRAARIQAERRARVPLTEAEKRAAMAQWVIDRELDDFTSAASAYTADDINVMQV